MIPKRGFLLSQVVLIAALSAFLPERRWRRFWHVAVYGIKRLKP